MALNIRKVDLAKYGPSDIFFLDTNVILYLHHPPSATSNHRKAGPYSNFIAKLRQRGCSLRVSSFNIQEVFHVVETLAHDVYQKSSGMNVSRKKFRLQNRYNISVAQASLWNQLKANYCIENAIINQTMLESFIKDYNRHFYDPIDYLFTKNHPTCNIITSDQDFSSDPAITIFSY